MQNYLITNRQPSATKKGPGRYHKAGHKKAQPARSPGGADFGFVLHQAAPEKQMRRELVQRVGRRQAVNTIKHDQRAYKLSQQED